MLVSFHHYCTLRACAMEQPLLDWSLIHGTPWRCHMVIPICLPFMEKPHDSLPDRVYALHNCRAPNKTQARSITCLDFSVVSMADVDQFGKKQMMFEAIQALIYIIVINLCRWVAFFPFSSIAFVPKRRQIIVNSLTRQQLKRVHTKHCIALIYFTQKWLNAIWNSYWYLKSHLE